MSASPPRRPPAREEAVLVLKRSASTVKVMVSTFQDEGSALTISYSSARDGFEKHKYIVVQPREARRVAAAIVEAADREGWQ